MTRRRGQGFCLIVSAVLVLVMFSWCGASQTQEENSNSIQRELDGVWNKAVSAMSQSDFDTAIPLLESYLKLNPSSPSAVSNLALSHFSKGNLAKAFFLFHEAVAYSGSSQNSHIHLNLGQTELSLWKEWGDWKKEMKKEYKVFKEKWKATKIMENVERKLSRTAMWAEAIREFEIAVSINFATSSSSGSKSSFRGSKGDRRPYMGLVEGYFLRSNFSQARNYALVALDQTSEIPFDAGRLSEVHGSPPTFRDSDLILTVAMTYDREGDKENAIIWYRKARDPSNTLAWIKEIELWTSFVPASIGDPPGYELAQKVLDELLEVNPEFERDPEITVLKGNLASMKGESDRAIKIFTEGVEMISHSKETGVLENDIWSILLRNRGLEWNRKHDLAKAHRDLHQSWVQRLKLWTQTTKKGGCRNHYQFNWFDSEEANWMNPHIFFEPSEEKSHFGSDSLNVLPSSLSDLPALGHFHHRFEEKKIIWAKLQNAVLFGEKMHVMGPCTILLTQEGLVTTLNKESFHDTKFHPNRLPDQQAVKKGILFLQDTNPKNYYHSLIEGTSRLLTLISAAFPETRIDLDDPFGLIDVSRLPEDVFILSPDTLFMREILFDFLLFSPNQVSFLSQSTPLILDELYVLDYSVRVARKADVSSLFFPPKVSIEMVRKNINHNLPAKTKITDKIVYVSRPAGSGSRSVLGENFLIDALKDKFGDRLIVHNVGPKNKLSVRQQQQIFSGASLVVGPHGAGISNILFCSPGTRVVEFPVEGGTDEFFAHLSMALGLEYWIAPALTSKHEGVYSVSETIASEIASGLSQLLYSHHHDEL